MAQDLNQYLETHKCQGFKPVPHYFPTGDFVSYFFSNERCHEQRVDDLLTVYLANDTKKLVGCKIEGVKHILDMAGNFGVRVDDGEVKLGLFFWMGASLAKDELQKGRYEELNRLAKDAAIDRREFKAA